MTCMTWNDGAALAERLRSARAQMHQAERRFLRVPALTRDEYASARQSVVAATRQLREVSAPLDEQRKSKIEGVTDYRSLLEVALWEIRLLGYDTMASFPIFTGRGEAGPSENIARGERFINSLAARGVKVWSQVPYLEMHLDTREPFVCGTDDVFCHFYEPLLDGGKLQRLVLIDGWQKSPGCVAERDFAEAGNLHLQEIAAIGEDGQRDY